MATRGVMPEGFPREKVTREWKCKNPRGATEGCTRAVPCISCRNRRNQASGKRKQREARKAVERATNSQAARFSGQLANEEGWTGLPFRVEVKSTGVAKPVQTFHDRCAAQAEANRAIGDTRPFVAMALPTGGRIFWVLDNDLVLAFAEAIVNRYMQ